MITLPFSFVFIKYGKLFLNARLEVFVFVTNVPESSHLFRNVSPLVCSFQTLASV